MTDLPPGLHPATLRWYDALPRAYRDVDADLQATGAPDHPLARFLSLLGDQLGELQDLLDRIAFVRPEDGGAPGDTSDLVDPAGADDAWLPWLARIAGINFGDVATAADRRLLLTAAARDAGSAGAIASAVAPALTGTRSITVSSHYLSDPWNILVLVRPDEAADLALVGKLALGQKPAGYIITVVAAVTWTVVEAVDPTWTAWEAEGSWNNLG